MDRRSFIKFGSLVTLQTSLIQQLPAQSVAGEVREKLLTGALSIDLFKYPPKDCLAGGYWWWLNGLVNKEGITRDLEEFSKQGVNDLLLVNSAGKDMPVGVLFLSDEWKELFRHALTEAKRLGIQIGVNLSSGWCMGGPWITPEMAGRWFLQSELELEGPALFSSALPLPGSRSGYDKVFNPPGYKEYIDLALDQLDYRDTAVLAFPISSKEEASVDSERKKTLAAKTNRRDASNFTKAWDVMGPTLEEWKPLPTDKPIPLDQVLDISHLVTAEGYLHWQVPPGKWMIVRTGHRMTGSRLSIAQPEADGLSVAWLNSVGLETQFEQLGRVLLEEAKKAHFQLKFFCDDSFEDGFPNWTADILQEFKLYRGYEATPYLPVLAGYIIGDAEVSNRFLHDYRKTVADCMADRHYKRFAELCHQQGLQVQNESAGPSRSGTMCMDTLKNLGRSDYPTGEFWLGSKHDQEGGLDLPYGQSRLEDGQNKVTKMVASAVHVYGKNIASAESYTTYRHWEDSPATLKQSTDRAFCEGINRILIHTATATRPQDGLPGYEYYAGTHFNPNVSWWNQSKNFLSYIGRCQYLLRKGKFVADALFYNGDWAPNIVSPKHAEGLLDKAYDYDVCNEEVLLQRLAADKQGLVLPDGMRYKLLVLPNTSRMPLAVLKKIEQLVRAGAVVLGPKPTQDPGLLHYPTADKDIQHLAAAIWGNCNGIDITEHRYGKGKVVWGKSATEVLLQLGYSADFSYVGNDLPLDFIHRSDALFHYYFVANLSNKEAEVTCLFRQQLQPPQLWDPLTGNKYALKEYHLHRNHTAIPLHFAPFQSFFVVFPITEAANALPISFKANYPQTIAIHLLQGGWDVSFDQKWGAPSHVYFEALSDWTRHRDEGIRYYSGPATYKKTFSLHTQLPTGKTIYLDLGVVKNIAEVRLNGVDLGVVWTSPWRVDISSVLKQAGNFLEIKVVNLWPNRLIGDAKLPKNKRLTKTNIHFKPDVPLLPSGLLGPVSIVVVE